MVLGRVEVVVWRRLRGMMSVVCRMRLHLLDQRELILVMCFVVSLVSVVSMVRVRDVDLEEPEDCWPMTR